MKVGRKMLRRADSLVGDRADDDGAGADTDCPDGR